MTITVTSNRDRVGLFYVSGGWMRDPDLEEYVRQMFVLLRFVTYRTEYLFHEEHMIYEGSSPLFDVCERGEMVPHYHISITVKEGLVTNVETRRDDSDNAIVVEIKDKTKLELVDAFKEPMRGNIIPINDDGDNQS